MGEVYKRKSIVVTGEFFFIEDLITGNGTSLNQTLMIPRSKLWNGIQDLFQRFGENRMSFHPLGLFGIASLSTGFFPSVLGLGQCCVGQEQWGSLLKRGKASEWEWGRWVEGERPTSDSSYVHGGWLDGLEIDFKISRKKRNFIMTKRIVNMITFS